MAEYWCPGRWPSSLVPVWTDARGKKQHTENILRAEERLRETSGKVSVVTRQIEGQRSAHLVDPNSLDRWPTGETSDLEKQSFQMNGFQVPRQWVRGNCLFTQFTVTKVETAHHEIFLPGTTEICRGYWLGEYPNISRSKCRANHAALSLAVCSDVISPGCGLKGLTKVHEDSRLASCFRVFKARAMFLQILLLVVGVVSSLMFSHSRLQHRTKSGVWQMQ